MGTPQPYYDTTAVTDVQWISPTESSASSSSQYRLFQVYPFEYIYVPKKEAQKERVIRQRAAFKIFYSTQYIPIAIGGRKIAEQKEVTGRKEKFKGLNRNLYV